MNTSHTYVGIDVASEPPGLTTATPNTDAGIQTLVPQVQALVPQQIVVEATVGYELPVVRALVEAGLPVIVVNPRQVRILPKPWASWPRRIPCMLLSPYKLANL